MTFLGIEINKPFDGVYTRSNVSCSITQYISGKRLNGRQDFLLGIDNRGLSRRGGRRYNQLSIPHVIKNSSWGTPGSIWLSATSESALRPYPVGGWWDKPSNPHTSTFHDRLQTRKVKYSCESSLSERQLLYWQTIRISVIADPVPFEHVRHIHQRVEVFHQLAPVKHLHLTTHATTQMKWKKRSEETMHAISSYRGNRPTNKHTNKPTGRTDYNTLRRS